MKVAMIGGGKLVRDFDRFQLAPEWEIWGLNNCVQPTIGRWTRWFNLHHFNSLKRDMPQGLASELAWAHLNPKLPCYVLETWGRKLPCERIFPRKELAKMPRGGYHCGSFDWMVAFAVYLGATEISIHGVNLSSERGEPLSAAACLEYWCGYAEGKGIKVKTQDCDLFYNYRLVRDRKQYGYDDWDLVEDMT